MTNPIRFFVQNSYHTLSAHASYFTSHLPVYFISRYYRVWYFFRWINNSSLLIHESQFLTMLGIKLMQHVIYCRREAGTEDNTPAQNYSSLIGQIRTFSSIIYTHEMKVNDDNKHNQSKSIVAFEMR